MRCGRRLWLSIGRLSRRAANVAPDRLEYLDKPHCGVVGGGFTEDFDAGASLPFVKLVNEVSSVIAERFNAVRLEGVA